MWLSPWTDGQGNLDFQTFSWSITDPAASCGPLSQEAEMATLGGSFVIVNDSSASGSQYIEVPDRIGNSAIGSPSQVEFCFNVTQAGTYKLLGTVLAPNGGSNSFYVTVDGLPAAGHKWGIPTASTFSDDYVSHNGADVSVTLTPGNHVVTIYLREDGTKLDKLALELQ